MKSMPCLSIYSALQGKQISVSCATQIFKFCNPARVAYRSMTGSSGLSFSMRQTAGSAGGSLWRTSSGISFWDTHCERITASRAPLLRTSRYMRRKRIFSQAACLPPPACFGHSTCTQRKKFRMSVISASPPPKFGHSGWKCCTRATNF